MDEIAQLKAAFILKKALAQIEELGMVVELEVPDHHNPMMPNREVVTASNLYVLRPVDSLDSLGLQVESIPLDPTDIS